MPEIVGGLWIAEYEFTRSFGVEPASASGKAVLGLGETESGLEVGDYLAYSFGGIVFYGIVSSITATTERESGREYVFQIVDNRVRLPWQIFFAQYNMAEEADAVHARDLLRPPSTEFDAGAATGDDGVDFSVGSGTYPGVAAGTVDSGSLTRGRVYRHRVPSQWAGGYSSYSYAPASAADILRSAFKSALGGFGFALDLHPDQSEPVFDIDANNGMTLAALVATLCDAQGLQVTLDGARTLRFERRGEGTLVLPSPPVQIARDGEAMSSDPTKVRVVGDRTLVQVNNVPLVPDWKPGWEAFISEPAWLAAVAVAFELSDATAADRAEIAAKAREITLRQYIVAAGDDPADFADHGRWGSQSRMNMEVWTYLNSIVYRSYRISPDSNLYGVPMRSLEVHDSLLCAVEIADGEEASAIRYRQDPVEFYPEASAYVIARGQPLDLLSVADREAVVKLRTTDMRAAWSEIGDFTLDPLTHSIRFASPVFLDGDPETGQSILIYPNFGQGDYEDVSAEMEADSDYSRVVLPNPDYVIEPAEVKVSLTFRLGPFHRDFGSGARWMVQAAPALAEHLLDTTGDGGFSHAGVAAYAGTLHMPSPGGDLLEILYDDGTTAIEQATAQAAGLIQKNPLERSGEYIRRGAAGTNVSGVIDRVTIRINRTDGIVETCEFAKPRVTRTFTGSREIARRAKSESLHDGQADLRREVRQLRAIARLERKGTNDRVRSSSHRSITDLFRTPIGGQNPGIVTFADPNGQWPEGRDGIETWLAGDLLWLDGSGLPSRTGSTFGGVVVAKPVAGASHVVVASSGTVPMAVTPGILPADSIGAEPGEWRASATGSYPLGMLGHGSAVPGSGDTAIALVRIGAGGGGGGDRAPFHTEIVIVPESDPPEYAVRVTPGFCAYQNAGKKAADSEDGHTGVIIPKIRRVAQLIPIDAAPGDDPPGPAPLIPLPAAVSYIYLRVKTDEDGIPKFDDEEACVVEAFDEKQKSIHHIRPSPGGGQEEGDYFFLILETKADESVPPKPVVKRRVTGNRFIPNQLIEIANIGGEREIYSGYLQEEDKYELRSLKQITDGDQHQIPVMKPLEDGEEEEDFIPWLGLGVDKLESPSPPVDFELGEDKKVGLLKFKGVDGTATFVGGSVTFAKGIATFIESMPEEGGDNFNIRRYVRPLHINFGTDSIELGSTFLASSLYVRDGLVSRTDPEDDGIPDWDFFEYNITHSS